ncbi:restriction endonuclease [Bacillus cabrialesii]|uniref:Restriction endonuclease n=1 Tax=Bacillus cabrialesii subsp. tritici TaxID=2944916 RepID=A0ABT9DGY3_9BACI|nr:restriction endonuclease [Bacillus cabrialesii]MDO8223944.1 restriction endonuclease [Bacillus cabrialesii subsp. tritici]
MIDELLLRYRDYLDSLGYIINVEDIEDGRRVLFDTSSGSPVSVRLDVSGENLENHSLWIYIRTTSWMFNGDRSDLHELISSIFAIVLKGLKDISVSIHDVEHPVETFEGEVYARVLTFERDNLIDFQSNEENDYKVVDILHGVWIASIIMDNVLKLASGNLSIDRHESEEWLNKLASYLGEDIDEFLFYKRTEPDWSWCKSVTSEVSIFAIEEEMIQFFKSNLLKSKFDVIKGLNREIIKNKDYYNSFSYSRLELGKDILKLLEGRSNEDIPYLVIENGFFIFGKSHFIFLKDDCREINTNDELGIVKDNYKDLWPILFPNIQFFWNDKLDGGRFEELTRDLLIEEDGISRVRIVSSGNDPDGGRDLEAEMFIINTQDVEVLGPYRRIKVLVQCKAYKKSVNKGNVTDIRDTIENHNAHGYFLIVSSNLTTQLYNHLSLMREKGHYWIDWWTRKEIEDRLMKKLHLVEKYKDIITYSVN